MVLYNSCSMNEQPLKEDIFQILRILASADYCTQRDLAHSLTFSLGKTNYLLKALANTGLIKIRNFSLGNNKIKKVKYILTQKGLEQKVHLTLYFLQRKEKEYLELKQELEKTKTDINTISNDVSIEAGSIRRVV